MSPDEAYVAGLRDIVDDVLFWLKDAHGMPRFALHEFIGKKLAALPPQAEKVVESAATQPTPEGFIDGIGWTYAVRAPDDGTLLAGGVFPTRAEAEAAQGRLRERDYEVGTIVAVALPGRAPAPQADAKADLARAAHSLAPEGITPCIGRDPLCPCQDGDACHYRDCGDTKAMPLPEGAPMGEDATVTIARLVRDRDNDEFRIRDLQHKLRTANAKLDGLLSEPQWVASAERDAAIARASELEKDLEYYKFLHGNQAATIQKAWDALAAAEAQAGHLTESVNKLSKVYIAARTLCFGTDWNNGSQAKYQGWRQSLVDAVNEVEPLPDCACRPTPAPGGSSGEAG